MIVGTTKKKPKVMKGKSFQYYYNPRTKLYVKMSK